MKLLLVEFLDLWERSPTWRNAMIAGLVGLIMVFFVRQSGVSPSSSTQPINQQQTNNNAQPSTVNQTLPSTTITPTTVNNTQTPTTVTQQPTVVKATSSPKKTPKKPSMSLDIKVGKHKPKPIEKTPQRNLNARQSDMPLDTPVGKPTSPSPSETSSTPQTRTYGRKPSMPLETTAESP